MTLTTAKILIRIMIAEGINKNIAFGIVRQTMQEEASNKDGALERFNYEINAEEQRRNDGKTTK